jgi:3-dehydroquinate synthase
MLFLHCMEPKLFSLELGCALNKVASEHGQQYREGASQAWGLTGAAYLGFALCGLPSKELRVIQYRTREHFGPIILDCKWYDELKKECLKGEKDIGTTLPGPDGSLCRCTVTEELILEMLDFCREG